MLPKGPIYIATEPTDMRKSFRGLSNYVVEVLGRDPRGSSVYCFWNKKRDRVKILWFDTNGYCCLYKNVERGRFVIPDAVRPGAKQLRIDAAELVVLLKGVQIDRRKMLPRNVARRARQATEKHLQR